MKDILLFSVLACIHSSFAHLESFYFPGYGFSWYDPVCGFACYNILSGAMLECSSQESMHGMSHGSGPTSPECYAGDTAFLTSLAYCMNSTCNADDIEPWRREKFWDMHVTGDSAVFPKWSYAVALEQVVEPPTVTYNSSSHEVLNETQAVSEEAYRIQSRFMAMFDHIEALQPRYIFVLLSIGFGTPIFFTLLGYLPFMTGILDKLKPYLVYPSTIGTYSVRPLPWMLGNAPTIGQSLYIAMFVILNVVLTAVNYDRSQPHPWYFSPREETLAYIGYRTGHISYALLPLVILFSGRNNFLLWITNWPYSTYILLHRWIARVFTIQAILHSITLLVTYTSSGSYPVESKKAYWLWGIVATVLACAMLVLSHLYFRRLSYEIFLGLHIFLAAFVIIGCWYHVILKWGFNFYDNWLIAASAVWFFDRLVRVVRVAKNGIRHATITDVGLDHVRVDIPGIRWSNKPGHVAYAFFPSLSPLRPWENHPFSVNSTSLFRQYTSKELHSPGSDSDRSPPMSIDAGADAETKTGTKVQESGLAAPTSSSAIMSTTTAGLTLVVTKKSGLTKHLKGGQGSIPVLLEGPYAHQPSSDILRCDRVVLVGGGIGITGLVAWTHSHPNVKLAWSVKSRHEHLVREMAIALREVKDQEILVGERLDLRRLLSHEAESGYIKIGVVVCGPGPMCDEVRSIVAGLGRSGKTVFELEVDAFSW